MWVILIIEARDLTPADSQATSAGPTQRFARTPAASDESVVGGRREEADFGHVDRMRITSEGLQEVDAPKPERVAVTVEVPPARLSR
mmetsp:Transcript_37498/g.78177  ORF Transcript_37498/g.78177 Transcript_37498/m.78177 type:complete len:87 (-) Transcript_37498:144-404(-)